MGLFTSKIFAKTYLHSFHLFGMPCLAHWYSVVREALLSCSVASSDTAILFSFKKERLRTWSKEACISQKFLVDFCLQIIAQAD